MAYATLMTPKDVTLSNGAVINIRDIDGDPITPIWSFVFQGDHLSWGQMEIYDVDTDEKVASSFFPSDGVWRNKERYNGDTITIADVVIRDIGVSGRNYKWLLRQYQNDLDTGAPLCNIRFGSGIIQSLPSGSTGTTIEIDKGITKLRNPYYFTYPDETEFLVGCTYIEVGHERRMITDYNISTGVITIESGFSSGVVSTGALYRLYTNFLESGYYDFKIRDIPTVTETNETNTSGGLHLTGTYSHPNHVNMESYKYRIYAQGSGYTDIFGYLTSPFPEGVDNQHLPIGTGKSTTIIGKRIIVASDPSLRFPPITDGFSGIIESYDTITGIATLREPLAGWINPTVLYVIDMNGETLIDESDRIYNYYLDYTSYAYFWGQNLLIELETVSKEKQITKETVTARFNTSGGLGSLPTISQLTSLQATQAQYNSHSGITNVYRKDEVYNEWLHVGRISGSVKTFIDWTAGNNHTYTYRFAKVNGAHLSAPAFTTNWDGWSISALTPMKLTDYQDNRPGYKIGETWLFLAGAQPNDIVHNLGIVQHNGTSKYPTTSRANTNFESGQFSMDLLTIECPSNVIVDNIERVERWKQFINGDNPFLLKSDKGDVWIVNIVDNPTRQYDEGKPNIWTTVSYSWVQVEDTRRAYII